MHIPEADLVRTLGSMATAETKVRGSRFLALAAAAFTRGDAEKIVLAEVKKYHAATHHCRAWCSLEAPESEFMQEDDGEPSGSAGAPILQTIRGAALTGVLVVVTRYFGGVKLGVGGLVRAYGEAAGLALTAAPVIEGLYAEVLQLNLDYPLLGRINQVLEAEPVVVLARDFGQQVGLNIAVALSRSPALRQSLVEASAGRIELATQGRRVVFPGRSQ